MLNNDDIPSFLTPEILEEYLKNKTNHHNLNIYYDDLGNLIAHKNGRGKKIVIAIPINIEELFVTNVDDNRIYFNLKDNLNKENVIDSYVITKDNVVGVIKKENSSEFIETFCKTDHKKGDSYQILSTNHCKGNKLYGRNLKLYISLKIAIELLNFNYICDNQIYFTLYFCEESVRTFINKGEYNYIFTLKYGIAENDFKLSEGCGIVYKDGNALISREVLDICEHASCNNINQPYFNSKKSILDSFVVIAKNAKLGSLCIPIKYMNSKCEIADFTDINSAIEILKKIIEQVR